MNRTVAPHEYLGQTLWGAWRYKENPTDPAPMQLFETEREARAFLSSNGGGEYKQIGAKAFEHVRAGQEP